MPGSRSKFAKVVRAAQKGKAVPEAIGPSAMYAHSAEEMIMLSPPLTQPTAEESAHLQPESSALGASTLSPFLSFLLLSPLLLNLLL